MAEKEYIDLYECRDDFYATVLDILSEDSTNDRANQIIDAFDYLPTADVAPVKHGKWIYNPNGMDFNLGAWECSVCTQKNNNLPCSRNISPYICGGSKYCPNCGAKMDGGEGE